MVVKDRERRQPGAGRLDLLLQDADGIGRYEVELQLGRCDESHIIRSIEYWDLERRRYPQYDHTAVIIAEDITSRFLNVVSLFNGFIPIMALQVTAIETSDGVGLHFTKILDTVRLGRVDDDEDTREVTDRKYWEEQRGLAKTVKLADHVHTLIKEFLPSSEPRYNKHYIGFSLNGKAYNFSIMRPQKNSLLLEIGLPKSDEVDEQLSNANLDILDYNKRWSRYRIKLTERDIQQHKTLLLTLLKDSCEQWK